MCPNNRSHLAHTIRMRPRQQPPSAHKAHDTFDAGYAGQAARVVDWAGPVGPGSGPGWYTRAGLGGLGWGS